MAKALMMLSRHHHILLPGTLCKPRPIACKVRLWFELSCELLVFLGRDGFHFLDPFVPPEDAVKPPVNEHPELRLVPPFHPARTVEFDLGAFVRRIILRILPGHDRYPCRGHRRTRTNDL